MSDPEKKAGRPEAFFGQFLVSEGIANETDVMEALNVQKKRTTPIGELAVQYNMLSMQQVFMVLNAQFNSKKLFGEIAGMDLSLLKQ